MSIHLEAALVCHKNVLPEALSTATTQALPRFALHHFSNLQDLYRSARFRAMPLVLLDDSFIENDTCSLFEVRRKIPATRLILVGDQLDRRRVVTVLVDGASGYISYGMSAELIAKALATVVEGGIFIPLLPDAISDPEEVRKGNSGKKDTRLTTRQHEVMKLLQLGKSNKEIARDLSISEATVKVHVATIFQVLRVHNRLSAVMRIQSASMLIPNGVALA